MFQPDITVCFSCFQLLEVSRRQILLGLSGQPYSKRPLEGGYLFLDDFVVKAEKAAVQGDGPAVLRHLKSAGKWTLGVAERIDVAVAAEAIKRAMEEACSRCSRSWQSDRSWTESNRAWACWRSRPAAGRAMSLTNSVAPRRGDDTEVIKLVNAQKPFAEGATQ
jgi:hypothetical protein